jgi:hypothetical protein
MRPYDYACGNNYHHSRQHTGRHVLQWPSEDKDRSRDQRQQIGRVVYWPIAVHFALHCLVVIHFCGEKAEIIVMSLHDFLWRTFAIFERLYEEMVMKCWNNKPNILVPEV